MPIFYQLSTVKQMNVIRHATSTVKQSLHHSKQCEQTKL